MLRCILLDDELHGLEYLRLMCERMPHVQVVRCFNDPHRFLREQGALEFDIVLLDIDMPGLTGLQVAQRLGDAPVIFTTAHDRFAADAFDLQALDFIRKPITRERLEQALDRARQHMERSKPGYQPLISVMTDRGRTLVRTNDIQWITTPDHEKRDKLMHLSDGIVLRLKTISLDQLITLLPPAGFARVNRSDIVALSAVQFVAGDAVNVKAGDLPGGTRKVPLGATYRSAFLGLLGA